MVKEDTINSVKSLRDKADKIKKEAEEKAKKILKKAEEIENKNYINIGKLVLNSVKSNPDADLNSLKGKINKLILV